MDENRNIYQQPEKDGSQEELPAYERTPDQMRSELRRKAVLFSLLLLAFGIFAGLFAWNEAQKKKAKSELRDMLHTPTWNTNAYVRTAPPPEPVSTRTDEAAFHDLVTNAVAAEVSPQRMADAMGEIRAASEYIASRDWDHAETHLTNALAIWPEMNLALRLRGIVFTQRGQFDEAIAVLERAVKGDPFNAEAFNTLATAYIQKKQFDRAEDLLQTALSIRPGYAATEVNLGLLYILAKKYDLAIEQLEAAAPQMPDNAAVLNNIGVCLIRLNRHEEARQKFQELIKHEPKRAAPYFNMAMSCALQNDTASAVSWIKQGAAQCSPADVQRFLADQDFDSLRGKPEYQALIRDLYPQLPRAPGS